MNESISYAATSGSLNLARQNTIVWVDTFLNVIETLAPLDPNPRDALAITVTVKVIRLLEELVLAFKNGDDPSDTAKTIYGKIEADFAYLQQHIGVLQEIIERLFHRKK